MVSNFSQSDYSSPGKSYGERVPKIEKKNDPLAKLTIQDQDNKQLAYSQDSLRKLNSSGAGNN